MTALEKLKEIEKNYLIGVTSAQSQWSNVPYLLKACKVWRKIAIETDVYLLRAIAYKEGEYKFKDKSPAVVDAQFNLRMMEQKFL